MLPPTPRPWRRRLLAKIIGGVVAAIVVIEAILLVPSLVAQRRHVREVRMTIAEALAHSLYQPVAEAAAAGDAARLMRIHAAAARVDKVAMVTLTDMQRITVACSISPHVGLTHRSTTTEAVLETGSPAGRWMAGEGEYRYAIPIRLSTGEPLGALEVSVDVSDLPARLFAYALRTLGLVLVILVFTALVVGIYFFRTVIRPVSSIVRANRAAATGDRANAYVPAELIPDDELGDIARTRNEMLAAIEEHSQDLETLILRGIADPIALLDADRRVLLRNRVEPATANGDVEATGSCRCEVHRRLPDLPLGACPVARTLASGVPVSFAFDVTGTAGLRSYEAFTFPLPAAPGEASESQPTGAPSVRRVIEQVRDVTDRRRLEETARRHERLASVGELAAGMAHEIRNPLASIVTSADLLDLPAGQAVDADSQVLLGVLKKESKRISRLLADFLGFARPRPLRLEPTSLNALIQGVADLAETHPRNAGRIAVETRLDPSVPLLSLDADLIEQAFLNLAINALEAMQDGGRLTFATVAGARAIEVTVRDTGVGMGPAEQARIFEPFHTTKADGTGLGLAIVYRVIERHGGTITVDSLPGTGTAFRVRLPTGSAQELG